MSSQVLTIELTAIAHEAKRKHPEIRTAADKALSELKSLASTSDQQLAADLSRRPHFIDPLVLAATSKNARLTNSALVCIQRLVVLKGLPRTRLADVVSGFAASTSLSLDIQLKILQTLPAFAQNYAEDLNGELLGQVLHVCATLQNVKTPTVSAVAVATLQQLIVVVFDNVAAEDAASKRASIATVASVESGKGTVAIRQSAYDAVQVLRDLSVACEGQRLKFLNLPTFPMNVALELIYAALNAHGSTFSAHPEFVQPLKEHVAPTIIRLLSDRQGFGITLRAIRIVPLLIQRHVPLMSEECEVLLGLLTHLLDPDSAVSWKRVLVMEAFKSIYSTPGLVVQLYMQYDQQERSKAIVRDNISSFVRLSTEKPGLIGLGQQSTVPTKPSTEEDDDSVAPGTDASNGTSGYNASTVPSSTSPGISSQWSIPRIQMMDLLDKADAPSLPETYIYSLTLECLNSLSDSLAKVILPLTMAAPNHKRGPRRQQVVDSADDSAATDDDTKEPLQPSKKQNQPKGSNVPINPLTMENIPAAPRVKAIAGLLEDCWPALLATSSTFLYSALDNDYYRGLIRSVQRFTQVAGLLDLAVARDAFMTTLGKAAAPPNLVNSVAASVPSTPSVTSPSNFLNSKTLLNINTMAQNVAASMHSRRPSAEPTSTTLTMRNLLCLRALINLAIALGPTLKDSVAIILGTLQHADLYLEMTMQNNQGNSLVPLRQEIDAVGAAVNRMMESTTDYPNHAFGYLVDIFCVSIDDDTAAGSAMHSPTESRRTSAAELPHRASTIAVTNPESPLRPQDRKILLAKFGRLAELNAQRFATYEPAESGWQKFAECLVTVASGSLLPKDSRILAADLLCRCATGLVQLRTSDSVDDRSNVQRLALSTIHHLVDELLEQTDRLTTVDVAVLSRALEALRVAVESHGDSFVTGWDIILKTIAMSFTNYDEDGDAVVLDASNGHTSDGIINGSKPLATSKVAEFLAPDTGRIAFSITQTICSDFLGQLKSDLLINVSDLLHKFSRQTADVNMSLTAITLFSDVSNFLLKDNAREALEMLASPRADQKPQNIFEDLRIQGHESRAAQWMINLHHLSEVAVDDRNEIRNGAFQMLLRILVDQSLDPHAFQFALTGVLLKLLESDLEKQRTARRQVTKAVKADYAALDEASKSLIEGIARYLAQNSTSFERTTQFHETWKKWMAIVKAYIALESFMVSQAIYSAMATTLAPVASSNKKWQEATAQALTLFDRSQTIPKSSIEGTDQSQEQEAFLSYIQCAQELLRLASSTIILDQIVAIAEHIAECVCSSARPKFSNDNASMTQVQGAALQALKSLRLDIEGWPQRLLRIASNLVRLPGSQMKDSQGTKSPPRFIAFSKAAMDWLVDLVKKFGGFENTINDGAVGDALRAFGLHVRIKYHWPKAGKPPALWKKATTCALDVLPVVVPKVTAETTAIDASVRDDIWRAIVQIASAVVHGDYSPLEIPASFADIEQVEADEQFDANTLLKLRSIIIPALDSPQTALENHISYCNALFTASIVHPLQDSERSVLDAKQGPLHEILHIRRPTFDNPEPSRREDLAYLCLAELISMSSTEPKGFGWHASSTFSDPYSPGSYGEAGSGTKRDLARGAAPYMVARFALSLRAYVADQPLRGRAPTPISVVQELVWMLQRMRDVRLEPGALVSKGKAAVGGGDSGTLAHIDLLHPLLVKAIGVAGHHKHGNREILQAVMAVLDVTE